MVAWATFAWFTMPQLSEFQKAKQGMGQWNLSACYFGIYHVYVTNIKDIQGKAPVVFTRTGWHTVTGMELHTEEHWGSRSTAGFSSTAVSQDS